MNINKFKRNSSKQNGFTLIELIIVIVIIGILAAVALPKFVNLSQDARFASLKSLKSTMDTTNDLAHAKYIVNFSATPLVSYTAGNITVAYNTGPTATPVTGDGIGYLSATDANFAALVGVNTNSYQIIGGTTSDVTATANSPAVKAGEIAFIPNSVANTPVGLTCFVKYTQSNLTVPGIVPDVVVSGTTNPC
jgi:MSHA pilin protein MshA